MLYYNTLNVLPLGSRSIVVLGSTVLAKRTLGTLSRHISITMTSSPSCAATPQLQDTLPHFHVLAWTWKEVY